ncbi:hypothetical protein ACOMHN_020483 [Nucella lapillus]
MWTLFLLHLVSFLWYQPAPCLQQLYPSFFSPALSHPLHYSSPPSPAPVSSVYSLRHYPPPLPSPPSSNLPMRYSRDQLFEIQPSTPNFELVNRLRELRLGVGLPRKRGCRGGEKETTFDPSSAFTQPPPADGPAFPPATSRPAVGSGQRPPLVQASYPSSYH